MWSRAELIALITTRDSLTRLILDRERRAAALEADPEPPAPRKSPYRPGSQEWFVNLAPPRKDDGVSMNELARRVPKPCPPRKPSWER